MLFGDKGPRADEGKSSGSLPEEGHEPGPVAAVVVLPSVDECHWLPLVATGYHATVDLLTD